MGKILRRLILSGVFAALTALLIGAALLWPGPFFSFYSDLSRRMLSGLAALTAPLPFALWEWLAVGLVVWAVVSLVLAIRHRKMVGWLCGLLMGLCMGVFFFTGLWGLNHFGPDVGEKLNLPVEQYSVQQLRGAAEYYLAQANELSSQVPRGEDGRFQPGNFASQSKLAAASFEELEKTYDVFSGSTAPVKPLAFSWLFGKCGITGIFVDFTGESCVSSRTYVCAQPYTVCHEMSHRMGFAAENEANFAAFLACSVSESEILRYSGYYEAFLLCYNALYKVDAAQAAEVWAQAGELVRADCDASAKHYEKVSSKTASKVASTVNDAYLKAFSEESGVKSYGEAADLLIAWYLRNL